MSNLKWNTEKRRLSDLIEMEKNPRRLTEKQEKDLEKSLKKFGLVEIPAITKDNVILAGHQRIKVLKKINADVDIEVRVPNRKLTEKEKEEYNIRSNKNSGEWDLEKLEQNFDFDDLMDWGFEDFELNLDIDEENETKEDDNIYNKDIKAPTYEPKGEKPEINELIDEEKSIELKNKIESSDIPDEVKDFLIKASYRHLVFDYEKIAEYYCHVNKDIQELMEQSALVIIDYNKAIEEGYVKLTNELKEQFYEDYENE